MAQVAYLPFVYVDMPTPVPEIKELNYIQIKNLKKNIFNGFNLNDAGAKHPSFSDAFKSSQETIRDSAGLFRVMISNWEAVQNSPASSSLGAPNLFNVFWGVSGIKSALQRIQSSRRQNDIRETFNGAVDLATNSLTTGGGVADVVYRGFKLAQLIEDAELILVEAPRNLSNYAAQAGKCEVLSTVLGCAIYIILALKESYNIYEDRKFIKSLKKDCDFKKLANGSLDKKEVVEELYKCVLFLEKQLKTEVSTSAFDDREINAAEKELEDKYLKRVRNKLPATEVKKAVRGLIKEKFYNEALSEGIYGLKQLLKALRMPALTSEKCEGVVKNVFSKQELIEKGRDLRLHKLEIKKESELGSHIGEKCLEIIKESVGPLASKSSLSERISSVDPQERSDAVLEAKSLFEKMSSFLKEKLATDVIILTCAVVALIVICTFTPFGLPAIATIGVLVGICLVFLGIDIKKLHEDLTEGRFEKYDKKLLILSSAICLVSMVAGVALTVLFAFSPWSLLFLGVGLIWLGMNGYTWHVLNRHEKENPIEKIDEKQLEEERARREILKAQMEALIHKNLAISS